MKYWFLGKQIVKLLAKYLVFYLPSELQLQHSNYLINIKNKRNLCIVIYLWEKKYI